MSTMKGSVQVEISPIPDWIDVKVIAADGTDTATVPSGVDSVFMTTTSAVWFRRKAGSAIVAAIPSADLADGKGSLYFSGTALFRVSAGEVLTFKAPAAAGCTVSLGWFGKAEPSDA